MLIRDSAHERLEYEEDSPGSQLYTSHDRKTTMADHVPGKQRKVESSGLQQEGRENQLGALHNEEDCTIHGDVFHREGEERKDLSKWTYTPQSGLSLLEKRMTLDSMEEHKLSPEVDNTGSRENAALLAHASSMSEPPPAEQFELKDMDPMLSQSQLGADSEDARCRTETINFPYAATGQERVKRSHQVATSSEEQATSSFFNSQDEGKNLQPSRDSSPTKTPPDMLQVSALI